MPLPSEAEIQAQISDAVLLLDETRKFGHVNGSGRNFESMEDALIQALETPLHGQVTRGLNQHRAALASICSGEGARALLDPLIMTYAQVLSIRADSPQEAIPLIADNFIAAGTKSVQTRVFSFGSVSAGGSNVGTGTVNRLTTDEDADAIENTYAQVVTIECVADRQSGRRDHHELFEIRGGELADYRDTIEITGSGRRGQIQAQSGAETLPYLRNPSFSTKTGTGASTTDIDQWTIASGTIGTEVQIDATDANTYREYNGSPDAAAVKFAGNAKITQALTVANGTFNPNVPYYCQLAYNREIGTGTMTLTLRLGAVSKAVALSAQTGWNILRIDLNEDCWFKNWNEDGADLEIEVSSYSTGTVLVDDVILVPMTKFDGLWYCVVGGATKFLADDVFTFTDTETGAKIQTWLWRAYGTAGRFYLPHSATPSWADPT